MEYIIRAEEEKDYRTVENVTREAFWDVYAPGSVEHLVVHNLRKSAAYINNLSLVICEKEEIIGHIMYTKACVKSMDGQSHEVLSMGPFSVMPGQQKKGIGKALMDYSIEAARALGFKAVIIFGDPTYYGKYGYINSKEYNIATAEGDNFPAFMTLELFEGALKGIEGKFYFDEGFMVKPKDMIAFDSTFPYKEKRKDDKKE